MPGALGALSRIPGIVQVFQVPPGEYYFENVNHDQPLQYNVVIKIIFLHATSKRDSICHFVSLEDGDANVKDIATQDPVL